jgi:hypothetical protein
VSSGQHALAAPCGDVGTADLFGHGSHDGRETGGKDVPCGRRTSPARDQRLLRLMHERPSLRPLAPLLGVLGAMWLLALALLAQTLL